MARVVQASRSPFGNIWSSSVTGSLNRSAVLSEALDAVELEGQCLPNAPYNRYAARMGPEFIFTCCPYPGCYVESDLAHTVNNKADRHSLGSLCLAGAKTFGGGSFGAQLAQVGRRRPFSLAAVDQRIPL